MRPPRLLFPLIILALPLVLAVEQPPAPPAADTDLPLEIGETSAFELPLGPIADEPPAIRVRELQTRRPKGAARQ